MAGVPSWRQVAPPHPEISSGGFRTSGFAARLGAAATDGPTDAADFFARTHLGAGLSALLSTVWRRLAACGGPAVIPLQAGFGDGKTHALAAVYHATHPSGRQATPGVLASAGIQDPPRVRRAAFVGTEHSPARPWTRPTTDGVAIATLWQDVAAQLRVAIPSPTAPPGASELAGWLDDGPPCALLLDELVAWLRALDTGRSLAAGSLDANLTFLQSLTEAVRRSRAAVLLVTLPRGGAEAGGPRGEAALGRLGSILGRGGAPWRPDPEEFGPILRRRLFTAAPPEVAAAVARAYAAHYAAFSHAFPGACLEPAYGERLARCHPLHPALVDRLRRWCDVAGLPGVRGALHLLAEAICAGGGEHGPLLLPGDLPLEQAAVRSALVQHRHAAWSDAAAADLAASPEHAGDVPRRSLRALALASPPGDPLPGLEPQDLCRDVVHPPEPPAAVLDALDTLQRQAAHVRREPPPQRRTWLDARPGPNLAARQRAEALSRDAVAQAMCDRLRAELRLGERPARFATASLLRDGVAVDDKPRPRLIVLPPWLPHADGSDSPALARVGPTLRQCGDAPRVYRNSLVFLAAEETERDALEAAARTDLAWKPEAGERAAEARAVLVARLRQAYRWLLVPVQDPGGPLEWESLALRGEGPLRSRAARTLEAAGLLLSMWSPRALRIELDRLWPAPHPIPLTALWEDLARYPYLPRLCGPEVLTQAVEAGVRDGSLAVSAGHLLRPGAALEVAAAPIAHPTPSPPLTAAATLHGADAAAAARRWLEAVVDPLARIPGARLNLTVRLEAELPADTPVEVVRAVRENARTLGGETGEP